VCVTVYDNGIPFSFPIPSLRQTNSSTVIEVSDVQQRSRMDLNRWFWIAATYHNVSNKCLCQPIQDHITTTQQQPFYSPSSGTTRVSRYQKKHSPTHHPDHHPIFISFFHLPRCIASSLFKLRPWQSFGTTSFHVLFGLPLGLEPSTSYSIHFYIQSVSSFSSTCPYHRNLFCCSINIISSIPSLSINSLLGTAYWMLSVLSTDRAKTNRHNDKRRNRLLKHKRVN